MHSKKQPANKSHKKRRNPNPANRRQATPYPRDSKSNAESSVLPEGKAWVDHWREPAFIVYNNFTMHVHVAHMPKPSGFRKTEWPRVEMGDVEISLSLLPDWNHDYHDYCQWVIMLVLYAPINNSSTMCLWSLVNRTESAAVYFFT